MPSVIKFKRSAVPLDEALETVEKLSGFMTFCVGFHAGVSEVDVMFEGQRGKVRLFRQMLCWKAPSEHQLLHIPFSYRAIKDQIEGLLDSWMNASAELSKARDILISLMAYDWRMPIDVSFVTTSQALEALSRHGYRQDSCALSDSLTDPPSGTATHPAESRPGSAGSPRSSPQRT